MGDGDAQERELEQQLEIASETLQAWKTNFVDVGIDRRPELEDDIARLTAELKRVRARKGGRAS